MNKENVFFRFLLCSLPFFVYAFIALLSFFLFYLLFPEFVCFVFFIVSLFLTMRARAQFALGKNLKKLYKAYFSIFNRDDDENLILYKKLTRNHRDILFLYLVSINVKRKMPLKKLYSYYFLNKKQKGLDKQNNTTDK